MDAGAIERLLLKTGEVPTAAHVQQLESLIARQQQTVGVNVRQTVLPWGTITHYDGGTGGESEAPKFLPTVTTQSGRRAIRWDRGLIAGIEPTIGGIPISNPKAIFYVPEDAFTGPELNVYFRLTISREWDVLTIEPFASAEVPPTAPWQADKLALILFREGGFYRELETSQGWIAVNQRSNGRAQHLFWSRG